MMDVHNDTVLGKGVFNSCDLCYHWGRKTVKSLVFSRVKTLSGLFLMSPIPEDIHFGPAKDYLDMIQNLRQRILATPEQVAELKNNSG
jgi:hypothetical protein